MTVLWSFFVVKATKGDESHQVIKPHRVAWVHLNALPASHSTVQYSLLHVDSLAMHCLACCCSRQPGQIESKNVHLASENNTTRSACPGVPSPNVGRFQDVPTPRCVTCRTDRGFFRAHHWCSRFLVFTADSCCPRLSGLTITVAREC